MQRLSQVLSNEVGAGRVASRRSVLRNGLRLLAGFVGAAGWVSVPAAAGGDKDKRERDRPERDGDRPEGPHPHLHPMMEREFSAKAQYLVNLPRFVDWPVESVPRADSPITIGVLAKPDFFGYLHRFIRDRRIDGRPLLLKPVRKPSDARDCHILYVNGRISERTPRLMAMLPKDQPILTVGESPSFLQQGGILNFAMGDRKLVLEVNPEAAKRASLAINPKLLVICKQPLKDEEK